MGGAHSRTKGASGEREICSFLRIVGWPDAERQVRTGAYARGRTIADPGDIRPGGGLVLEAKRYAERLTMGQVISFLVKVRQSCGSGELGVLVERTPHVSVTRAAEWVTWWHLPDLLAELRGQTWPAIHGAMRPVAVRLGDAVEIWQAAGRCPTVAPRDGLAVPYSAAQPPAVVMRPAPAVPADPFAGIPSDDVGWVVDTPGTMTVSGGGWSASTPVVSGHAELLVPADVALGYFDPFAQPGVCIDAKD